MKEEIPDGLAGYLHLQLGGTLRASEAPNPLGHFSHLREVHFKIFPPGPVTDEFITSRVRSYFEGFSCTIEPLGFSCLGVTLFQQWTFVVSISNLAQGPAGENCRILVSVRER